MIAPTATILSIFCRASLRVLEGSVACMHVPRRIFLLGNRAGTAPVRVPYAGREVWKATACNDNARRMRIFLIFFRMEAAQGVPCANYQGAVTERLFSEGALHAGRHHGLARPSARAWAPAPSTGVGAGSALRGRRALPAPAGGIGRGRPRLSHGDLHCTHRERAAEWSRRERAPPPDAVCVPLRCRAAGTATRASCSGWVCSACSTASPTSWISPCGTTTE